MIQKNTKNKEKVNKKNKNHIKKWKMNKNLNNKKKLFNDDIFFSVFYILL